MSENKSRLTLAKEQAESAINETNEKIGELGTHASQLNDALDTLEKQFDAIRNIPSEKRLKSEVENLKEIRLNWKRQAEKIESDYNNTVANIAAAGAIGVGVGVTVVTLGPSAAMGIATTFGVASTGTAISTLSGAAAAKAGLAWLGGGAIAAGGGGMAAGKALLALAGPVGWAIGAAALVGSALFFWGVQSDKNRLENIFALISERDTKSYQLAIVELNERISRIADESQKLIYASNRTKEFGLDYSRMTAAQQYELGSYVNLMNSSYQLLVNPISGLQPKYDIDDLRRFKSFNKMNVDDKQEPLIVSLANLLFKIDLNECDRYLLWNAFKSNKEFLASMKMSADDFEFSIMNTVINALRHKDSSNAMMKI